ncbi:MAG TPA: DUF4149 domain-containing protein [Methylophilaceae bacterium]|nr:DUF4149 domain-containing protein [Methylophilaceae bacterium]
MLRKLALILLTLWIGSLWMTGLSANILFKTIEDSQLAGHVAGHLFTAVSYIGLVSGAFLLMQQLLEKGVSCFKQYDVRIIAVMLVLILVGFFGIQAHLAQLKLAAYPQNVMQSVYAAEFSAWHAVSGAVYLIECLLGGVLVLLYKRK